MARNNITRKLRFLPYLPYGLCSKTATTMKGKYNPYARQLLLGEDPKEIEKQNEQERKRVRYNAKDLVKKSTRKTPTSCVAPPQRKEVFAA